MEPRTHWLSPRSEAPAPYDAPPPYEPRPFYDGEPPELGPPPQRRRQSRLRRTLGPIIAAIVAFAAKFKALILLLPKIKLLATAGTMFVSLAAYAWLWGWQFAAGFIALLFVHEMGHVIQLRREGIRASGPMFIPFLGAVITSRSLGDNATAEARVGLAGPIVGSIGAAACILVWHATGNDMWRALAFTGFLLNLFNLIPVVPLDGGRAMAAMAPWMWVVGFVGMIAAAAFFPNPIIILILLFGAMETWRRWKARRSNDPEQQRYYRVKPAHRLAVAAVYIGLIVVCAIGMDATHLERAIPN
jgi:Zn-dependent protease